MEPSTFVKVRILHDGIYAMGPGKADLLEAVGNCHSIAGAGRALGYSYWKTRHLIDEMNTSFRAPVVETMKGGHERGGAVVTETGRQALAIFRGMEAKAQIVIREDFEVFKTLLS
jgi:molybdate transport system regulatory protein